MSRNEEFRLAHQPQASVGMHEVERLASDIHTHPEYYNHGDHYAESLRVIKSVRNQPNALVAIHRAVPPGVTDTIGTGDWVSPSHGYAKQHGMHATDPSKDWPVLTARVPARHVHWDGNDANEFGYFGPPVKGHVR